MIYLYKNKMLNVVIAYYTLKLGCVRNSKEKFIKILMRYSDSVRNTS